VSQPPTTPLAEAVVDLAFPHRWQAEILRARPAILPAQRFVYPRHAEEVERGALEVLIRPAGAQAQPFLATCALGFRDPAVPTGIWSCPQPDQICTVSGGYAYVIDTLEPERFTMIPFRPVLAVRSHPQLGLLLFVGHHAILAWDANGQRWRSEKLSDEGVTISSVEEGMLYGLGWSVMTDKETAFALDLCTGLKIQQ